MIPSRDQWAVQIDVTSACPRRCSNCTRPAVAHGHGAFYMPVEEFRAALTAVREFCDLPPDRLGRRRVIGMIGGEPLQHPSFPHLAMAMMDLIPPSARGLWTGLPWEKTAHADLIRQVFGRGYINNNKHDTPCFHQPVLVASQDVVADSAERQRLIDACPLQQEWASAITPKGFFFCEVAAGLDMALNGPGGLPVEPGCWQRPLSDFQPQIDVWCQRCGVCLPLSGRRDSEHRDDISPSNLATLRGLDSPRILAGDYVEFTGTLKPDGWAPLRYLREKE